MSPKIIWFVVIILLALGTMLISGEDKGQKAH